MSDNTRDFLFSMFIWRANDYKNELDVWERKYSNEKDEFHKEMIDYYKNQLKELYAAAEETLGTVATKTIKKYRYSK